jgi:hypothetical protein
MERLSIEKEDYVEDIWLLRAEVEKQGRAKRFAALLSLIEFERNSDFFERLKHIKIALAEEFIQLYENKIDAYTQHSGSD